MQRTRTKGGGEWEVVSMRAGHTGVKKRPTVRGLHSARATLPGGGKEGTARCASTNNGSAGGEGARAATGTCDWPRAHAHKVALDDRGRRFRIASGFF
ncbi:hypothetical protein chiPu_0004071 [Chiloscyllium punctatum]|uniref:Uncharacterized protein n=1 Tax=Chiloscyllium punctatum TaxID=137246 RepID=A0A401S5H9_CHIPU|nr:hypothetical protein [Chiloscyllium punctatum]